MPESLPPNPPKQDRSRRTLERIVKASLAILDEEGPEALTVQSIVERADSSVGSFYARFEGKEELLDYLGERVWREAAERWDEAMASRDWSELDLRGLVEGAVRLLDEAGRSRASYLGALGRTAGGGDDAYAAFQAHVLQGLEGLLLARTDEMDHAEPALAVRVGLRAVLGILDPPGGSGESSIPPARQVEEATTLLLAYLIQGGERGGPTGQVDFFDIWG